MRNVIVGTAGHIDHGKTALIRALTGVDTDRLEEEKRRGISIDLGFAHLELPPDAHLGFVDVPGHERFVKNMLAGVGGIDLVLFVVAADESIKPQTREHFDICRLLGISRGIVALTKSDLVDADVLGLARLEVEEFVKGSFLEGSPIVEVSAVTGEGLDVLRRKLAEAAGGIREKDISGHFRLPIDRSFSMHGFGTVVTGTLVSGSVRREQEVEVQPGGRILRVRGIQVHGHDEEQAFAGQRTALNLAGAEPSELARGMVLTEPRILRATDRIDCVFDLLLSAKPLKHRAPVHFHAGTAEVEAEVRLMAGAGTMEPGTRKYVQILLREPILILPGDRFIVRMFSPVVTIGGGVVLDIEGRRRRRILNQPDRFRALEAGSLEDQLALLAGEAAYGFSLAALVARTGIRAERILSVARSGPFTLLEQPDYWVMDRKRFQEAGRMLTETVRAFHKRNPLLPGIPKQELRGREMPDAPPFVFDALLGFSEEIVAEGESVRLKGHKLVFRDDEQVAVDAIEKAFAKAGLAVPSINEVLAKSGVEPARARSLLQILLRQKRLIRINNDLVFHSDAIASLRVMLGSRKGERFGVPAFKDWTGISRKYAIPLLEFLDRERVTRRDGDQRVIL